MRLAEALVVTAALLAAVPSPLSAQGESRSDEQARRLLEDGRSYRAKGQIKQAVDNFNTIVTGFPGTDVVDEALIEIGRYHVEVEGNADKARQAFEQVTKGFPQSDGAPGAYYHLGRLALSRASTGPELDDALAQFTRVQRLYPRSVWVPEALYAAGLVHRKAGRLAEAVDVERRVSLEYPSTEAAAAAQYEVGLCLVLLGDPRQAMEELQQVRNRFTTGEWPDQALDAITLLYRFHGAAQPVFSLDETYQMGTGDVLRDVQAILARPDGGVWVASSKTRSVVQLSPDGKVAATLPIEDPQGLGLTPAGELLAAARLAVRIGPKDIKTFAIPGEKPGVLEPLEHIRAAVLTPGGSLLVADRKQVQRFDRELRYQAPFPDAREREVTRLVVDGHGGIVVLDRDEKTVRTYDETGRVLRTVGGKGAPVVLRDPVDVAVDRFRNLYIADEGGSVVVVSSQGQLLATVGAGQLKKPQALALEPNGAVLVYDAKQERILRFK